MRVLLFMLAVVIVLSQKELYASGEGFQISAPPIAYPYFEEGKTYYKFEPVVVSIDASEANINLSGVGINYIYREAVSDILAVNAQGQMFALSGDMPGMYPSSTSTGFYAVPSEKSKASMISMMFSGNIELQAIKDDSGSLIVFGGINLGMVNTSMQTAYNLVRISDSQTFSGYTDSTTISSSVVGLQFGMQGSFFLGDGFGLSPFFMMTTTSGTATYTDEPGYSGGSTVSYSAEMPEYTTTSFGMDIIIDDISIGTLLQNVESSEQSDDINIVQIKLGYFF